MEIRLSARGFVTLALAFVTACSDRTPEVDTELARDLELATSQPAVPHLADAPLDAPEVAAPEPRTGRPGGESRSPRAQSPQPRPESPHPRPESPQPRAESPEPAAESPEPSPESRAPAFRGIQAGVSFGLSTRAAVCTSNLPGDKVVATVTSAVIGEDGAVIPVGTSVVLEVASVTPGSTPEDAQITLRLRSVVVGDEARNVGGSVAIESGLERGPAAASGSDKKKVIGGAIAGAVVGQILGRDTRSTVIGAATGAAAGTAAAAASRKYHACLPAGASVRVTTSQPIVL